MTRLVFLKEELVTVCFVVNSSESVGRCKVVALVVVVVVVVVVVEVVVIKVDVVLVVNLVTGDVGLVRLVTFLSLHPPLMVSN